MAATTTAPATAAAEPPAFRYSTGSKPIGDAKNFAWECPIPINRFWDDFSYVEGRNFIQGIAPDQLEDSHYRLIDPQSTQTREEKLELLLQLLQDKLVREDAAAAPQTLWDVDFERWSRLWLGMYTFKDALHHPDAEDTLRMMIQRNKFPANRSHEHTLSAVLFNRGAYAESEALEREVMVFLIDRLGATSPQALGSRRIIAQAVWKQGPARVPEARKLLAEVFELIEESRGDKYAVYADEQKEITEDVVKDLEEGRP